MKEQKIRIEGIDSIDMEDFMKNLFKSNPELQGHVRLEKVSAKDSKGIELKTNQEVKQLSTGHFFKIDENKTFRNLHGIEVDFDRNDENVYEDLLII